MITNQEITRQIEAAKVDESRLLEATAPTGAFTPQAIKALVNILNNTAAKLLGAEPIEVPIPVPAGRTKTVGQLPAEIVRPLLAFSRLIADAIAAEVLDDELQFNIEDLHDDQQLALVGGKIKLLDTKAVAKWLQRGE
jgi:hypothetical protein